jgi:hypothetical protein
LIEWPCGIDRPCDYDGTTGFVDDAPTLGEDNFGGDGFSVGQPWLPDDCPAPMSISLGSIGQPLSVDFAHICDAFAAAGRWVVIGAWFLAAWIVLGNRYL